MSPPAGSGTGNSAPAFMNFLPLIAMVAAFYWILIRPQQKKAKEHENLLKSLKGGDRVVTSGGLIGVVISVKDKAVSLRCADAKLEVLKSSISEVTERSSDPNVS